MRRNFFYALLSIAVIAFVVWAISKFVQPILPSNINEGLVLFFVALLAVAGFLGSFKDIIELVEKFSKISNPPTNNEAESPSSTQATSSPGNNGAPRTIKPPHSALFSALTYHRLIGRVDELERVMSAIRDPKSKPLIAIIGLGGMGKTALALEVVKKCQEEGLFDHVIGVSTQTEHFVGEGIEKIEVSDYTFDKLLGDIGQQSGRAGIVDAPLDLKTEAVRDLLLNRRVLILLDNLETVRKGDKLVDELFQIIGNGKVLITSRHRVRHDRVFSITLGGLSEDESVTFLRETSKERNIDQVTNADRATLVKIFKVTGGAPLAMKLVIGQMEIMPISQVLKILEGARFKSQDYEFYRFVFKRSWDDLTPKGRTLLVAMRHFVGKPIEQAVRETVEFSESDFYDAVALLIRRSLIDVAEEGKRRRYSLHPLTRYFINSDIVPRWQ